MAVKHDVEPEAHEASATPRPGFGAGPVPSWAKVCAYPDDFKGKPGTPITHLLLSRQIHAEKKQTCVQSAVRLETMEAVQHESQWRLQFDPNTQTVCLHWIRIRRGTKIFDHTRPERFRILQREEALEGFIVDGFRTLLMLLEDVRPGDILEAAYTITTEPRLLPENCWSFFGLPPHISVGSYYYSICFAAGRKLQWKASAPEMQLEVMDGGEERLLVWSGDNHTGLAAETNVPDWHIDHPWVQVSDCADWQTVAAGFAAVWQGHPEDSEVTEIIDKVRSEEPELLARVERVIRLIQDEFRYLSVDLETGGHVPAAPGLVARRRYGDCKDLSFLLVHLLRGLGISARPVLVNTRLRKAIADKLPMPGLFDHVVVEVQLPGGVRWVDPTLRNQGGNTLDRVIPDYNIGLPVDPEATALMDAPAVSGKSAFELRESLLLDTAGGPTLLAITVQASGSYAENLRHQFECCSLEDISRERLDACKQRFGNVERQGVLTFRDDRKANEFRLAEVFEIPAPLVPPGEMPESIRFSLPSNMVSSALSMPENTERRTPYALPYPCDLTHTIELHSQGLEVPAVQRKQLGNAWLRFSRSHKVMAGFWSVSLQLSTSADAVPAEKLPDYRKLLQEIGRESAWEVVLATGFRRMRQRGDFGTLPPRLEEAPKKLVPGAPSIPYTPRHSPARSGGSTSQPYQNVAKSPAAYREEVRRWKRRQKRAKWVWSITLILVLVGLVALFIFAAKH